MPPDPPPGTEQRGTEHRGTGAEQRATTATGTRTSSSNENPLYPNPVSMGYVKDEYGRYWDTDEAGHVWVSPGAGQPFQLLSTPRTAVQVMGRAPAPPEDALHRFADATAKRWSQQHGPFLGIAVLPIAEVEVRVGRVGANALKLVPEVGPELGGLADIPFQAAQTEMDSTLKRWKDEADQRDREFTNLEAGERDDPDRLPTIRVRVKTAPRAQAGAPPQVQMFVASVANAYRRALRQAKVRYPNAGPPELGRLAERAALDQAETLARAAGLDPGSIWIGDFPVGITGPRGGASTTDMGSTEYRFTLELKKSPKANRRFQEDAHEAARDEGPNFEEGGTSFKVYGENFDGEGIIIQKIKPMTP